MYRGYVCFRRASGTEPYKPIPFLLVLSSAVVLAWPCFGVVISLSLAILLLIFFMLSRARVYCGAIVY